MLLSSLWDTPFQNPPSILGKPQNTQRRELRLSDWALAESSNNNETHLAATWLRPSGIFQCPRAPSSTMWTTDELPLLNFAHIAELWTNDFCCKPQSCGVDCYSSIDLIAKQDSFSWTFISLNSLHFLCIKKSNAYWHGLLSQVWGLNLASHFKFFSITNDCLAFGREMNSL